MDDKDYDNDIEDGNYGDKEENYSNQDDPSATMPSQGNATLGTKLMGHFLQMELNKG